MKGSVTIRFVALNTSSYSTLFANSTTEFPSGRRNIINTVYRLEEHCKLEIGKIKKNRQMVASGISEFMRKTFQAAQLTHERFLTIDRP